MRLVSRVGRTIFAGALSIFVFTLVFALLHAGAPAAAAQEGAAAEAGAQVLINEIFARPRLPTERLEFVELHNPSAAAIDVGRWQLRGAIDFVLPAGARIEPGGYLVVAEDPAALRRAFGADALGPFARHLAAEGETVELHDQNARLVDAVRYGLGFPWPTGSEAGGESIQLLNPALDNALAAAWRAAAPTPARANSVLVDNPPPFLHAIHHEPAQPRPGQAVTVTVQAADANGIDSVRLGYQWVAPGAYIPRSDPAYATEWVWLRMQQGADGLYRAVVPAAAQVDRSLVRYRVEAVDGLGALEVAPYADDPQPNFAWYVQGDIPPWSGSITGGPEGVELYDFASMRPVPIYTFLGRQSDIADALFIPPSARDWGYQGADYLWHGTLVHNGIVYDHVTFRARGGAYRYVTGKTHWKLNFLHGHSFQPFDAAGQPIGRPRDKLNLSAVQQRGFTRQRGEQGLYESLSFRLFELAGVHAPETQFIHLRVVDDWNGAAASQYEGDFWGLYLAIEQMDGSFLEEHGLPDGNLYKMDVSGPDRNNLGRAGPANYSDIRAFLAAVAAPAPGEEWWRQNVDLPGYYSYRAVLEFLHHYDVDTLHNYFYYSNPVTNRWSVLPWDADLTWSENGAGTGVEPFLVPVLGQPAFQLDYQNRLRALRDLLLNEEQIGLMIDEYAAQIDTPAGGPSLVDANRALWDWNPILSSRYVAPIDARPGSFYESAPGRSFAGVVASMKQYSARRVAWIDSVLLTDRDMPATPTISYAGAAGYPADGVRLAVSDYADPQGAATFAAMQWRVAEVTDPAAPSYDASAPLRYEIEAAWESEERTVFARETLIPAGVLEPGHAYRARVRLRDADGRWSHWSAPLRFVAGPPSASLPAALQISEIMYHPALESGLLPQDLEYVELHNGGSEPIDLGGAALAAAVSYTFPVGTLLPPGGFLVVAGEPERVGARYGVAALGPMVGRLDNAGETITVLDAWGRPALAVRYDDEGPWPAEADGSGYSLVYEAQAGPASDAAAWRPSAARGGSPGALDAPPVRINEVMALPAARRAVELWNEGGRTAYVGGWYLGQSSGRARQLRLPPDASIAPGSALVVDATALAAPGPDGALAWQPQTGGIIALSSANAGGALTGFQAQAAYPAAESGVSYGHHVDSAGQAHFVALQGPTFGAANAPPRAGPIVISAFRPAPDRGPEWIELANVGGESVPLYDPLQPERPWIVVGGYYPIPAGIDLPPGGRVLITAADPAAACAEFAGSGFTRVLGPWTGALADAGQQIALLRPVSEAGAAYHVSADSVRYGSGDPWPTPGANALRRTPATAFGHDPASWQVDGGQPGSGASVPPTLCSLRARFDPAQGRVQVEWTLREGAAPLAITLWRADSLDRAQAVRVATLPAPPDAAPLAQGSVSDPGVDRDRFVVYWLEAEAGGQVIPLGRTSLERAGQSRYLPLVAN